MPYINQNRRNHLVEYIEDDDRESGEVAWIGEIDTAGELQYVIAEMIKLYVDKNLMCYQTCNDVMGALAGAQMEFYRRHVAPYEDEKIEENGDV